MNFRTRPAWCPTVRRRATIVSGAIALLAATLVASPSWANLDPDVIACRAAIGKSATRLTKALTKVVAGCHKARNRDAALSGRARAFCASDHGVVYESGIGGCP